jgi:hypothetical protein
MCPSRDSDNGGAGGGQDGGGQDGGGPLATATSPPDADGGTRRGRQSIRQPLAAPIQGRPYAPPSARVAVDTVPSSPPDGCQVRFARAIAMITPVVACVF